MNNQELIEGLLFFQNSFLKHSGYEGGIEVIFQDLEDRETFPVGKFTLILLVSAQTMGGVDIPDYDELEYFHIDITYRENATSRQKFIKNDYSVVGGIGEKGSNSRWREVTTYKGLNADSGINISVLRLEGSAGHSAGHRGDSSVNLEFESYNEHPDIPLFYDVDSLLDFLATLIANKNLNWKYI